MRRGWMAGALLLVACTSGTPSAGTPSAAASPTPHTLLFAALESVGDARPYQWNTVIVGGLDGRPTAEATFTPMPTPYVGCAGAHLPPSAHVAAGAVYYADGAGAVKSLSPQGLIATVTTIPFTGTQQMLSFAVSPDGSRLLAAVFTLPAKAASGDACSGAVPFAAGDFTLDVYSAHAGAASHLLYHEVLPTSSVQPFPNVMAFMGWDKIGPEAAYPTQWATQGGGPHPYGTVAWVDPSTGKIARRISNPDSCLVWDVSATGDFVCTTVQTGDISVRSVDGTEIWGSRAAAGQPYQDPFLSPQGDRVVSGVGGGGIAAIVSSAGGRVPLGIYPLGWLDDTTVIGGGFDRNFLYARVNAPDNVLEVGLKGAFVGTVQS